MVGDPYARFAKHYNMLYGNKVPYSAEVKWLLQAFSRFGNDVHSVLDLGCGTGIHALALAAKGYDVVGLDRSAEMLGTAKKSARLAKRKAAFVQGDMSSFSLGRNFDAVICMFGGWGYLLERASITSALRRVRAHLKPGGLFIMEFWGIGGVHKRFRSWDFVRQDVSLIRWSESKYDGRSQQLAITMHHLVYRRKSVLDDFTDRHVIKCYRLPEMRKLLSGSGFLVHGLFSFNRPPEGFRRASARDFNVMAVASTY